MLLIVEADAVVDVVMFECHRVIISVLPVAMAVDIMIGTNIVLVSILSLNKSVCRYVLVSS